MCHSAAAGKQMVEPCPELTPLMLMYVCCTIVLVILRLISCNTTEKLHNT